MNASEYKSKLIKLCHLNKKNVFYDDEQRKDFIKSRFNADSLKDMKIDELNLMLDYCKGAINDIPAVLPMTCAQEFKIKELWNIKARNKTKKAFDLFILNRTSKNIKNLTKVEAKNVLIALDKMV